MTDKKAYKNFDNENDDTESEGIRLKVKKSSWISHYTPVKILKKIESQNSSIGKMMFKSGFKEIKKYFFLEEILMYSDTVNSLIFHFTPSSSLVFKIENTKDINQDALDNMSKYTNIVLNTKSSISCSKCFSNSLYPIFCSKCDLYFCLICILKHSDHLKREITCLNCKTLLVNLSCINKEEILSFYQTEDVVSFLNSYYNCVDCCKIIDVSEYLSHLYYKCKSFNDDKDQDDSSNLSVHNTESNKFNKKKLINSIDIGSNTINKKSLQEIKNQESLTDNKNSLNNAVSLLSDIKSINNSKLKGKNKDHEALLKTKNEIIDQLKTNLNNANEKIQSYENSYAEINHTLKDLRDYQHLLTEKNEKLTTKISHKNKTIENILDSIKCDICFSNKMIENLENDSDNSFHSVNIFKEDEINDEKGESIDFTNASNSRKKIGNRGKNDKNENNVVKKLFKTTEENENKSVDNTNNDNRDNLLINTLLNNQKNNPIDSNIIINKCFICNKIICDKCKNLCPKIKKYVCINDYKFCNKCKKYFSRKQMSLCKGCNSIYCDDCLIGSCSMCCFEFSNISKDNSIEISMNGLSASTTDKLNKNCYPTLILLSKYISLGVHKIELNYEVDACSYVDAGVFILRNEESYNIFIKSFFNKEIVKFGQKITKISIKENCPYLLSNIPKHPLFVTIDCNVMTVEFEVGGLKLEKIIESNCLILPYFILCKNKVLMHCHAINERI